jgi:hypothetical protein
VEIPVAQVLDLNGPFGGRKRNRTVSDGLASVDCLHRNIRGGSWGLRPGYPDKGHAEDQRDDESR